MHCLCKFGCELRGYSQCAARVLCFPNPPIVGGFQPRSLRVFCLNYRPWRSTDNCASIGAS